MAVCHSVYFYCVVVSDMPYGIGNAGRAVQAVGEAAAC